VQHAHDVSDGGLAVCLAESVIHSDGLGLEATLPAADRLDAALFGEAQSRVVVSVRPDDAPALHAALTDHDGVRARRLGAVTTGPLRLTVGDEPVLDASPAALTAPYEAALPDAVT
jgi:phosphoribosylformylglycinamidine (FGAM) synthase-like enzyme